MSAYFRLIGLATDSCKVMMKKVFFILVAVICFGISVNAQDVIVTKEGKKINAKVTEINENDIRYKNFDNLDGPSYFMKKSEISTILYQNGKVDVFNTNTTNNNTTTTPPTNYNTIPTQTTNVEKEGYTYEDLYSARRLRNAGITCFSIGAAFLVAGSVLTGIGIEDGYYYGGYYGYEYYSYDEALVIPGAVLITVGGHLIIPGIICWAVGSGRIRRINAEGISLFENNKMQLNLAVGGTSMGLKLNLCNWQSPQKVNLRNR